jgi:hypothetical protein
MHKQPSCAPILADKQVPNQRTQRGAFLSFGALHWVAKRTPATALKEKQKDRLRTCPGLKKTVAAKAIEKSVHTWAGRCRLQQNQLNTTIIKARWEEMGKPALWA